MAIRAEERNPRNLSMMMEETTSTPVLVFLESS